MEFLPVTPIFTNYRAARLTSENIEDVARSLNGSVTDGVLTFSISNHTLYAIAGDWLVAFGTDIHVYTDKYFRRNYRFEVDNSKKL